MRFTLDRPRTKVPPKACANPACRWTLMGLQYLSNKTGKVFCSRLCLETDEPEEDEPWGDTSSFGSG